MASGLWHRKDGYQGRKCRPLPPARVLDEPEKAQRPLVSFTLSKRQLSALYDTDAVPRLVSHTPFRF